MHSLVVNVIAICWIAFWLYWIISAFGSKKGTMVNVKQFIGIRIVIFALAVASALLFNHLPQSFKNHQETNGAVLILGFVVFLFGLMLAVWARIYLGKNWGMPMTQKQDPELVTVGPYHYIRHPIYSGILLMTLGSAIDINIYWLLVFIVAASYFIYSAMVEERFVAKQFPKVYSAYKAKTKMLVPWLL